MFRDKTANTANKGIPYLTRKNLEFFFSHSLAQIMARPTRITDQTTSLVDHIQNQSTRRHRSFNYLFNLTTIWFTAPERHPYPNHIKIIRYSFAQWKRAENFLENLREIVFQSWLIYICVNDAYSDWCMD